MTDKSETAIRLAQGISALPPLPATAQEILTCFGDEFIEADKVTAVVELDPGICTRKFVLAPKFPRADGSNAEPAEIQTKAG